MIVLLPHHQHELLSFWRELWEERADDRSEKPKRRPALRAIRREEVLPPEG